MPDDFSLTGAQVEAAQAGDRQALERLFERYLPRVTRIVAARIGRDWRDLALAEDVVQETFVDAFAAIQRGQIDSDGTFCSWLARCVQNNLRDQFRRDSAQKRGGGNVERFADLSASYLQESMLEGDGATPSQHASARETEAQLEQAMLRLDPRYREIVCLRAYARLSYSEIAEQMDLRSENTANVLFLRARSELQKLIDG